MNTQRTTQLLVTLAALAILPVTGCKPDAATQKSSSMDSNVRPPDTRSAPSNFTPANAGEVRGVVHFNGKPPARVAIDMSMDPGCSMAAANLTEQYLVSNGRLANVYVYIKSGTPPTTAPSGAPPVIMDQKGCRYLPHVLAIQQGATVEFRNSDPTMHNIHATPANSGNPMVDVSQSPMGQPQQRQFTAVEVMLPVRCNNHPWMSAFINVAPNPFFAVTSTDGEFDLRNLPPGHYTLAAVHEKLGEQDLEVDVPASGAAKADFNFAAK